ncbi:MAG: D-aminoacyl-tRNA deacylase [Candidatus Nanoarchaeia archaeon]|nr:D-aminoacyl-tRNA deacylase [Candidatus Nanoarchaeia archaeon]MDD5740631.1 D-aminoacyl-tRNA deacylase [Candidatus Nanoarchaeia archaeon]
MRFAVVYSKKDVAGKNIVGQLRNFYLPQVPIIELKKETVYSEDISDKKYPELKNPDFLIFASKHKSEKGNPSLSLHAPGNFRSADFGGKLGRVCSTSASVLKYLFQELSSIAKQDKNIADKYQITMEVTHHGPLIRIPCCFIELGSSENQWNDEEAAKIIAKTIASLQDYRKGNWIPAIGIGGPHYCPNFNKIQLSSRYALSHIIAEYNLPLTESMLKEAIGKTLETINTAIIDWKGCGNSESRQKVLDIIKKSGLEIKRTNEIEK